MQSVEVRFKLDLVNDEESHFVTVMRDLGADAGANVEAQGIRVVTAGLLEDDLVPEMAEDGCPAG